MGVRTHVRLHYKDGRVIVETFLHFARENGVSLGEAKQLLQSWIDAGDLKLRKDGGYDVVRQQPRQKAQSH